MGAAKILNKEISHYVEQLNMHQKEVVLSVVKTLAHEENEWWAEVEENAAGSIQRGLKQGKSGKAIPHEEIVKKRKRWLSE